MALRKHDYYHKTCWTSVGTDLHKWDLQDQMFACPSEPVALTGTWWRTSRFEGHTEMIFQPSGKYWNAIPCWAYPSPAEALLPSWIFEIALTNLSKCIHQWLGSLMIWLRSPLRLAPLVSHCSVSHGLFSLERLRKFHYYFYSNFQWNFGAGLEHLYGIQFQIICTLVAWLP